MHFTVFAISSVPDTATARRLLDLGDLDDKGASKVLFHRRKQQTGASEQLRWDQRAIASLSLIQYAQGKVLMDSMSSASHSEEEMLHAFYKAVLNGDRMVSWGGESSDLPLIQFRTLKYRLSYPAYWQSRQERSDFHLDIRDWLAPSCADDLPGLDEIARTLDLPGMLDQRGDDLISAWLDGRHADIQAFSDTAALNTCLLALQVFSVTGEIAGDERARVTEALRDALSQRSGAHLGAFLSAWSTA